MCVGTSQHEWQRVSDNPEVDLENIKMGIITNINLSHHQIYYVANTSSTLVSLGQLIVSKCQSVNTAAEPSLSLRHDVQQLLPDAKTGQLFPNKSFWVFCATPQSQRLDYDSYMTIESLSTFTLVQFWNAECGNTQSLCISLVWHVALM